jgi:hypothetical protein
MSLSTSQLIYVYGTFSVNKLEFSKFLFLSVKGQIYVPQETARRANIQAEIKQMPDYHILQTASESRYHFHSKYNFMKNLRIAIRSMSQMQDKKLSYRFPDQSFI